MYKNYLRAFFFNKNKIYMVYHEQSGKNTKSCKKYFCKNSREKKIKTSLSCIFIGFVSPRKKRKFPDL